MCRRKYGNRTSPSCVELCGTPTQVHIIVRVVPHPTHTQINLNILIAGTTGNVARQSGMFQGSPFPVHHLPPSGLCQPCEFQSTNANIPAKWRQRAHSPLVCHDSKGRWMGEWTDCTQVSLGGEPIDVCLSYQTPWNAKEGK